MRLVKKMELARQNKDFDSNETLLELLTLSERIGTTQSSRSLALKALMLLEVSQSNVSSDKPSAFFGNKPSTSSLLNRSEVQGDSKVSSPRFENAISTQKSVSASDDESYDSFKTCKDHSSAISESIEKRQDSSTPVSPVSMAAEDDSQIQP